MKNGLEVYCPKCGKLFKGEDRMFQHLEKEHISDKEHVKELILEIDARYLSGHPLFTHQINGNLSLYSHPQNKVVFRSAEFILEIPVSKIKRALAPTGITSKDNIFVIEFDDGLEKTQTVLFDHSDYLTDFANELFNLRVCLKAKEEPVTKRLLRLQRYVVITANSLMIKSLTIALIAAQ